MFDLETRCRKYFCGKSDQFSRSLESLCREALLFSSRSFNRCNVLKRCCMLDTGEVSKRLVCSFHLSVVLFSSLATSVMFFLFLRTLQLINLLECRDFLSLSLVFLCLDKKLRFFEESKARRRRTEYYDRAIHRRGKTNKQKHRDGRRSDKGSISPKRVITLSSESTRRKS